MVGDDGEDGGVLDQELNKARRDEHCVSCHHESCRVSHLASASLCIPSPVSASHARHAISLTLCIFLCFFAKVHVHVAGRIRAAVCGAAGRTRVDVSDVVDDVREVEGRDAGVERGGEACAYM